MSKSKNSTKEAVKPRVKRFYSGPLGLTVESADSKGAAALIEKQRKESKSSEAGDVKS